MQMTLQDWTSTLAALGDTERELPVRYSSGVPVGRLCSWRGNYAELTLPPSPDITALSVAALLEDARRADGGSFEGYKGGTYTMNPDTPVWADPWGEYAGNAPVGVVVEPHQLTVITANRRVRWTL